MLYRTITLRGRTIIARYRTDDHYNANCAVHLRKKYDIISDNDRLCKFHVNANIIGQNESTVTNKIRVNILGYKRNVDWQISFTSI